MANYTQEELTKALCAINSIIHKCEKAQEKFPQGNSHHTLLKNRLNAMYLSKVLITEALAQKPQQATADTGCAAQLLSNLEQLHTTDRGADRVKRNLHLDVEDVVAWCRENIQSPGSCITRKGKNWYIVAGKCEITVNANSYTIITAHRHS